MTEEFLPPEVWADEGQRIAPALRDVAAAIVTGRDPAAAAAVALGIARAHAPERRVAVADLVGNIALLTPQPDQIGLLECLRDGAPISEIGQPWADVPEVYVLPSGRGTINERWVFESARWERLVAGFREMDALLLLVTPPDARGLAALIARVDGVVAVDLPPRDVRAWPLLATVDHPEPELPPIPVRRASPMAEESIEAAPNRRGRGRWILATVALVAVAASAGLSWWRAQPLPTPEPARLDPAVLTESLTADSVPPAIEESLIEMTLGPLVNPSDSAIASEFAVELVAANTLLSANSRLASLTDSAPAKTVAPVVRGTAVRPWFHALVGAWTERRDAEMWLAAQRAAGSVKATAGRVVSVPYALLLEDSLAPSELAAAVARWEQSGVRAYGLLQVNGRVRVFAGAFESAGHAGWLASMLRESGATPLLAYRTGRMF